MKLKATLIASALFITGFSFAQDKNGVFHATEIPVFFHGVTERLDTYVEPADAVNEVTKTQKDLSHVKDWPVHEYINPDALPHGEDPALQKVYPHAAPATKALIANWDAQTYSSVSPADPTVDVGPNHVVQMINGTSGSWIRVYSKTGTPLTTAVYFDNFMGMPGGAGDPIVMYDERADRWILTEFSSSGNNMHVAVSTSPDPTGSYYTYTFNSPSGFPDYPKYSIWENEYIITANVSSNDIYALNRTNLLAGTATPAQMFTQSNFGTIGFQAATPVSMNGTTLPPSGQPAMVMRMRDDAWSGAATDALEIWEVDIDWVNSANSTFSQKIVLNTTPIDTELCGYTSFSCIAQPGTTTKIDPLREILMNRIHYRNFGTHESIVTAHVTDVSGTDRAGIRWYELRRTGGTAGSWTIYQEGTYSPDTDSRWMPSIGIAANGNIGMAYSVSSSTTYPSLRYTGRKECDPLGVMTEPETNIVAGTTSHTGDTRWGDYFALGTDPSDGETFYFTGSYTPVSTWRTRIAAFKIDACVYGPEVKFDASTYTVNESDASTAASACLDYVTVDVPISIGVDPSQPADITITVDGGTATEGSDFDLTNTSFTLDGSTLTGTVTVTIYNDEYVESAETIILGYTLNANGGDAYEGTFNQSVTITINDDDVPLSSLTHTYPIFSYDFESGLGTFTSTNNQPGPANLPWQVDNATNASSASWTIPAHTNFAYVNDDDCNCNMNSVDLFFPSVNLTGYTSGELKFDHFYQGQTYSGDTEVANLLVSIGGGAYTVVAGIGTEGSWTTQTVDITSYMGNADVRFKINYSDATGWLYGCAIDNVEINGVAPLVAHDIYNVGAGATKNLGPYGSLYFLDPATGDVMASITNTSDFDYGCITVEVDRDGTTPGAEEFNSPAVADYLHTKTFKIVPTNENPTGTYDITLYYKEAEVAAWEAATGNSRANAEIVKVAGNNQISDVTPATAGSYTIDNVAASVGAFNADVTFTASFTTGFSGFGVGIYNPAVGNAPVAGFTTSTTTVCAGSSVDFTDASTESPTSWSWNFGGAGTSTQQNPTFTFSTAGSYDVTLTATNAFGSGTSSVTTITVLANATSSQSVSLCPGDSYTVGTSTYTSAGTYTDVLVAANGCDSTVTTTITMLPAYTSSQDVTICDGSSYSIGSSTYTTAGTYTDVLTAANGCDSTVTTNLTVVTDMGITQDVEICSGSSYTVGTSTYTTSGTYTDVLTASTGCDSTVVTNLSVVSTINTSQDVALCPGESVTVGTSTYNSAGTYTDTFVSAAGCDSVVTTNVTMLTTSSSTQNPVICQGESVTVGTSTYTTTGSYTDVLTGSNGCDSTVTTNLTVLPTYTSSQSVTLCDGDSYTVGTSTYTSAGTFTDVLTAANGCDSTVTTNISIVSPVTYAQTLSICPGGSVTVGTSTYSSAGTYTDVLTAANGCDSTVTTTVTVLSSPTTNQTIGLCPGESVTVGTSTYNSAGSYTDVLTAANGCDSTVNTTVNMLTAPTFTQDLNICEGSAIMVGTSTYNATGTYTDVLTAANGCDSTVTTNLTVDPLPVVDVTPNVIDPICVQNGVSITLIGSPAGGTFSGTGVTGNVFDATAAGLGVHTITYTYTDGNGCTNTIDVTAEVVDCAGITENNYTGISLFPNPTNGAIAIRGMEVGTTYEVYDSKGKLVAQGTVLPESGVEYVSMEFVESGVYHLRANIGDKVANMKFIVTK